MKSYTELSNKTAIEIQSHMKANRKTQPWLVSLQMGGVHKCTGSIINDFWILTSFECLRTTGSASGDTEIVSNWQIEVESFKSNILAFVYPNIHAGIV